MVRKTIRRSVLLAVLALGVADCGGGGSDESHASKDKASLAGADTSPVSTSSAHGIRLLHASIDSPPLALHASSDPGAQKSSAAFGSGALYGEVGDGRQVLTVSDSLNGAQVKASSVVNVRGDARYTAVVYGRDGAGFALFEDSAALNSDSGAVRVINGVQAGGALGVGVDGGGGATGVPVGGSSGYLSVSAGTHTVTVSGPGVTARGVTIDVEGGKAYTVLVAGLANYFVTTPVYHDTE